jgi:hypothetical protein
MKLHFVALCTSAMFAVSLRVAASTLYGSTSAGGAGELWILDAANGNGIQDVGPLNDSIGNNYAVTGLAFHPVTRVLYGSTGGRTGALLLTIDPTNALVTVVGSYNAGGATMSDIAFDSAGNLYGISSAGGANLYSIDTASGNATEIGSSGIPFTSGGGLAISPGGVFYCTPVTTNFGTLNPTTGAFTLITNPARPAGSTASYAALAFDGNTLYGLNLGTPPHLVTFDPAGNVTDRGTTPLQIDGIGFLPASAAPARPTLAISSATNHVVLAWTSPATFRLQQNTNLATTNWVANTNSVSSSGGTNQVTVPAAGNMFFRLIYP